MKYSERVVPAEFVARPNRFIALVERDGKIFTVHVKNTGRCRELLIPGAKVYIALSDDTHRKTPADLIAVEKIREDGSYLLINMDSQAPNKAAYEWVKNGLGFSDSAIIRREYTHGDSRFDLYIEDGERRAFIEVKGVTLEKNGIAMFPDAPTERGVKHLNGLISCVEEGFEAYILFIVQMNGTDAFTPNEEMHPEFASTLRNAVEKGVTAVAVECRVTPTEMIVTSEIKLIV